MTLPTSSTGQTVMVIDDDVPLRTAFSRALERRGYTVVATTGSLNLLDLITYHQPSAIVMDNHMPEANGVELISLVRTKVSAQVLPIVLVSGSSVQQEIDNALLAGADGFLRKPVDLSQLIATVDAALANRPVASTDATTVTA